MLEPLRPTPIMNSGLGHIAIKRCAWAAPQVVRNERWPMQGKSPSELTALQVQRRHVADK